MDTDNNTQTAIITISKRGVELGRRLRQQLPGSRLYLPQKWSAPTDGDEQSYSSPVREVVRRAFQEYRRLVLVMTLGIAVRSIAGEIEDKHRDPAVVVVDDSGKFAVSLLSGHVGGANDLARKIATSIGALPVITTASDSAGTIAVDLLGKELGWVIEDSSHLTAISASIVNGEPVGIYQDAGETDWWPAGRPMPDNVTLFQSMEALCQSSPSAALIISDHLLSDEIVALLPQRSIVVRPKTLAVGIGCNRGTPCSQIEAAIDSVFSEYGLAVKSIRNLATIDAKKDEGGLLEFAARRCLRVDYFDPQSLSHAEFPSAPSALAEKHMGTPSVAESAAILSSGNPSLVVPKERVDGAVTIAVGTIKTGSAEHRDGKLFLVGLGPGSLDQMTLKAREIIGQCDVVVGYSTYVELIRPLVHDKEVISTAMGAEVERAKKAISLGRAGRRVAFVSSGDSGVYGMAGLVGEILREEPAESLDIEVVPGVTSLVAAAALLGAPVTTDFASVSLSDYLVPWDTIASRLEMAAKGDFVTVLYNPMSRRRRQQLVNARNIFLAHRAASTPVGIVTSASRSNQDVIVTTLEHMLEHNIGMETIIIIGNSTTFEHSGRMVTPRGYGTKYSLGTSA